MKPNLKITGRRLIDSTSESLQKKYKKYYKNTIQDEAKSYDDIVKNGNYDVTIHETIFDNAKNQIISLVEALIFNIITTLLNSKKSNISVIGIGDSPSIFLQVLEKLLKDSKLLPNLKLKNFPISSLRFIHNDEKTMKIAKEKMEALNEEDVINNSDFILWVDYVSTGNSFFNFMDIIPEEINKKSNYFIYGSDFFNNHPRFLKDVKKNKRVKFLALPPYSIASQFLSTTIGHSEYFFMRCIEKKEINDNFKLEIVDNEDLPHEKSIEGKHCTKYANYLYKLFKTVYGYNYLNNYLNMVFTPSEI